MKKLYFLFFLTIGFLGNAQIINFPDNGFKSALLQASPIQYIAFNNYGQRVKIDTNNNGEIEYSEALLIYKLDVHGTFQISVSDLTGISAFENLTELQCWNNQITNLDVTQNLNLTKLVCRVNSIISLNVHGLVNLQTLECDNNQLSSLDVTQNINLNTLNCDNNLLSSLDVTQNPNLNSLICTYNILTTLDLTQNPNLYSCFVNDNQLTTLFVKNSNPNYPNFSNNPNLIYICCDESKIIAIQNELINFGNLSCSVNSYCSFVSGGTYYEIVGNTKFDFNSNGCDGSDINYPDLNFSITDGTNTGSLIPNLTGNHYIPVQAGNHTITPNLENPSYFNISPTNFTVDFPTQGTPFTQDFCVTANGVHSDVEIVLVPITPARPGFDATYKLVYRNKGNQIENGTVTFSMYNPDVVDFVSSLPNFNSQTTNPTLETFSWNYSNLQPFETREIYIVLNINSPMETPPVNGGDLLSFDTQIVTSNTDENLNDNFFAIRQVVVNSYDPNDKTCLQGETIPPSEVGKYVHYVIRFENTGTFPAENIVVKDLIDLAKFDIATLVPLNSSHDFYTRINGNKVEFIFENINLDFNDATNDGYVAFKIKTLPSLILGDTFTNNANIYFDYNFPITTNTYTTTVAALSTQDFDFGTYFTLYPNPANDVLNIQTKQDLPVNSIEVYNQLGQVVLVVTNAVNSIDVADLASGTYFVKVNTEKGSANSKFVKE